MCVEIARFANASAGGTMHEVEFTTDWGGQFSKEQNVLAEKHCEHGGFEAGKQLCGYLMENTPTEFAAININRALDCIGAPRIPDSLSQPFQLEYMAAKFEAEEVKAVRDGILVGVEYSYGFLEKPPSLRIYASCD